MKAETADYLEKARATLADARQIAALPLPHIAAREAYLAVFHAAQAYIFERSGKVATKSIQGKDVTCKMADKKLDLIDLKNIAEQPYARGIRIHPKTWERLMQNVPKQPGGVPAQAAVVTPFLVTSPSR